MPPPRVGVPALLLQECINKKITVDTSSGEVYTGKLILSDEYNMSLSLGDVTAVFASGKTQQMESVYIKGQKIRFITLPDSVNEKISFLVKREAQSGGRGGRGGFRGGRGRGGGGRSYGRR